MTVKIAVINDSTVLTDAQVLQVVAPMQKQIDRDAGPVWGISATLRFIPRGSQPSPDEWWLVVLDNSDQAGALGYHDLTDEGLPLSKVFAGSDITYRQSWTVTCSHELLEMLVDPNINLTVFDEGPVGARLYAYEVCDACEADQFGYEIDGVLVSDFVYPGWFESFRAKGSTQFDYSKKVEIPFQLLPGGYIGVNDIASGLGWTQIMKQVADAGYNVRSVPPQGSRRQRRGVPANRRERSVSFAAMPHGSGPDRDTHGAPLSEIGDVHVSGAVSDEGAAAAAPTRTGAEQEAEKTPHGHA